MHKEFDRTVKHYKITGRELCEKVRISTAALSKFRSGKINLTTENLNLLLSAMDEIKPGSRRYFCMLLAGENPEGLAQQVEFLSSKELAALLNSVADRLAAAQTRELVGTLT